MQREVRRLHRLVNDLQTLSRVEAGQVSLQLSSFDLLSLVQHVLTQLQPQAGAQQLALHLEEPAAPVQVYADPDRTSQMLLNLVGNAIRYTPASGSITLRLTSTNRMACLTVTDTGVGIPAEALPYIFERFYRVDRSRARSSGGSGIGLTIARHLAWAMGGDITASSPGAGQGSSFCLTLPLATGDLSP
jgi:histidine kinase